MMLASRLLESPICTAEMDPRLSQGVLFRGEEMVVAQAVRKRRLEFIAGRTCARRAMVALGYPPAAIPQGVDRAPVWPTGLTGTISHTSTWCAAAVARYTDGIRSLGLDLEPAEPLTAEIVDAICLPEERAWLDAQPARERGVLGTMLFSAKECTYKCQYGVSRTFLDYPDMRIDLDLSKGCFLAIFQRAAKPFAMGVELQGRLLIHKGWVCTAMTLIA